MIRFLKNRIAHPNQAVQQLSLGRLEFDLMQILWRAARVMFAMWLSS